MAHYASLEPDDVWGIECKNMFRLSHLMLDKMGLGVFLQIGYDKESSNPNGGYDKKTSQEAQGG